MNWAAVRAGYTAAFLLMVPFFLGMVWAGKNENHGLLIFLMLGWLIFGNVAFFKAYNKKKNSASNGS